MYLALVKNILMDKIILEMFFMANIGLSYHRWYTYWRIISQIDKIGWLTHTSRTDLTVKHPYYIRGTVQGRNYLTVNSVSKFLFIPAATPVCAKPPCYTQLK